MNKATPLLLLVAGLLLAWLAITGRLAVFLAALFTPNEVTVSG